MSLFWVTRGGDGGQRYSRLLDRAKGHRYSHARSIVRVRILPKRFLPLSTMKAFAFVSRVYLRVQTT